MLLPGTPAVSVITMPSPQGNLVLHRFQFEGVIDQLVMYVDYAVNVEEPSQAKKFLDHTRDSGLANMAQGKPRLIKETDVSTDGHPGRFLKIEVGENTVVRMKSILVANRVYVLIASSRKAQPNVMGSENDYEEIAMAFLDSFHLVKR